ncbi:MAG: hypothetical protein ACOYL6_16240 [Bacteriovoracaceae bacterium]
MKKIYLFVLLSSILLIYQNCGKQSSVPLASIPSPQAGIPSFFEEEFLQVARLAIQQIKNQTVYQRLSPIQSAHADTPTCGGVITSSTSWSGTLDCSSHEGSYALIVYGDNITFDGGSNKAKIIFPQGKIGILVVGSNNVLKNTEVKSMTYGMGILAFDAPNVMIENNTTNNNLIGITLYAETVDMSGVKVRQNESKSNSLFGVRVNSDYLNMKFVRMPRIESNNLSLNQLYALHIRSPYFLYRNDYNFNTMTDSVGGLYFTGGRITISNVDLSNTSILKTKIFISEVDSADVTNSNFSNLGSTSTQESYGLHFYRAKKIFVDRTTTSNLDVGIKIATENGTVSQTYINNSSIKNNGYAGIVLESYDSTELCQVNIAYNDLEGNTNDERVKIKSNTTYCSESQIRTDLSTANFAANNVDFQGLDIAENLTAQAVYVGEQATSLNVSSTRSLTSGIIEYSTAFSNHKPIQIPTEFVLTQGKSGTHWAILTLTTDTAKVRCVYRANGYTSSQASDCTKPLGDKYTFLGCLNESTWINNNCNSNATGCANNSSFKISTLLAGSVVPVKNITFSVSNANRSCGDATATATIISPSTYQNSFSLNTFETNGKAFIGRANWNGKKLSEVSSLSYKTLLPLGTQATIAPMAQITIDLNNSSGDIVTLTFEPKNNGTPAIGVWQTWTPTDSSAKFSCEPSVAIGQNFCDSISANATYSLEDIVEEYPNALIINPNAVAPNPSYPYLPAESGITVVAGVPGAASWKNFFGFIKDVEFNSEVLQFLP